MMDRRERALAEVREAQQRAANFSGWSFKDVRATHLDARIPWDYEALARERARDAAPRARPGHGWRRGAGAHYRRSGLPRDSDRGVVCQRAHRRAPSPWARRRPARVQPAIPFADCSFDLVLDRHEALEPAEVGRVLAANGSVITQQVGPDSWPELRRFFPRKTHFCDHFAEYQRGFEAAGLEVSERRWHEERVEFGSLTDVVYMLLVAPWTIPDFDPERELDALLALEEACGTADGGIVLTEHHYLIVAQR